MFFIDDTPLLKRIQVKDKISVDNYTFITVLRGIGQGGRSKFAKAQIFIALYAAVGGRTFIHLQRSS